MINYFEYNLKLSYRSITDRLFVPLCQGVISSLTKNSHFPDVGALLAELKTAYNDYLAAIPAIQDRSPARTVIKDAKKDIVKNLMRTVGFHCLMVARNDYEKLSSTGFPMAKFSHSSTPITFPTPLIKSTYSNGTPNQLIVKCRASKAVKLYDIRTSVDQTNWTITTFNKSEGRINNLPTEVIIYLQLRYRNGDHETPWSSISQTRIINSSIAIPITN